ncbi:transcription cofactor vestigial-like protein 1 [Marmota flaviventris]|uniref:transcription cofactor vestigial-like protein 1 n=1 Tax=Marmota flaviventris TaxID=93162 RepID=UPI003A890F58
MAEMNKTDIQQPKDRQKPIKTEWNSQCVIFTYFQGDINSVVDEHFSRALSNIKRPQGLNSSSQSEDVILRNDSDMPPNQWRFSSPWTKSQLEMSRANSANNSSLNMSGPLAMNQYPLSLPETHSVQPRDLWHFPSLASPRSLEPGYSHVFPDGHLVPEPRPDGKCEPLLGLLQQDRCLNCPQKFATREDRNPVQIAGSTGLLFNLPPRSVHCKKIYVSPSHGPASPNLANEISLLNQLCDHRQITQLLESKPPLEEWDHGQTFKQKTPDSSSTCLLATSSQRPLNHQSLPSIDSLFGKVDTYPRKNEGNIKKEAYKSKASNARSRENADIFKMRDDC